METLIETKVLVGLDDGIISDLEKKLKLFQEHKFPKTRGPSGFYNTIRQRILQNEELRKEQRRLDFMRNQLLKVDSKISPVVSPKIPFEFIDSEAIFEMEMEPADSKSCVKQENTPAPKREQNTPKSKRKTWKKLELSTNELQTGGALDPLAGSSASPSPKIWKQSPEMFVVL